MPWQEIVGHDDVVEQFRRRLIAGRITGTYLFVGPAGTGKRLFAMKLGRSLLCQAGRRTSLDPCGTCEDCMLTAAGTHPDLLVVSRPEDRSYIPLELFIGPPENRMRQGLCHDIAMKPFRGGRRIAVIDDADSLNEEGANSLLKTLEEPPPKSVMILIGTSPDRQLPTIRSRAQLVRFQPLPLDVAARLIQQVGLADDETTAGRLAAAAEGSLDRARSLADPVLVEFRRAWLGRLCDGPWNGIVAAQMLVQFAEEAGKEAGPRRERLRRAIGLSVDFFRAVLHVALSGPSSLDGELQQAAASAYRQRPLNAEKLSAAIERCLEALEHIDRNVHHATLVDALCDDVAKLFEGR